MREIKFRAWTKEGMIYLDKIGDWSGNDGFPAVMGWENGKAFILQFEAGTNDDWEDSVLMQFTGLYDKNGTEIYEWDILKTESGICKVIWFDKGACFRWLFDGDSESPLNYDDREIIGNIYENPELLK